MYLHGFRGWRPLNGRQGLRMAVWLEVKVLGHWIGNLESRPRLYACLVCDRQRRCNMQLVVLYKCYTFTFISVLSVRFAVCLLVVFGTLFLIQKRYTGCSRKVNLKIFLQLSWQSLDISAWYPVLCAHNWTLFFRLFFSIFKCLINFLYCI